METGYLQIIFVTTHWLLTLFALSIGFAAIAAFLRELGIEKKRRQHLHNTNLDAYSILDE